LEVTRDSVVMKGTLQSECLSHLKKIYLALFFTAVFFIRVLNILVSQNLHSACLGNTYLLQVHIWLYRGFKDPCDRPRRGQRALSMVHRFRMCFCL